MADGNEEVKDGDGAEEKPKKVKKPGEVGLGFAAIVIGVCLVICIGLAFLLKGVLFPSTEDAENKDGKDTSAVVEENVDKTPENEMVVPEQYECIVNIAGTDGSRYLKIILEVAYDADLKKNKKTLLGAATNSKSRLRNKAIDYLSALTLKEVLDKNAKKNIRRDLLREFNKVLGSKGEFSNVYIVDYIVQ